MIIWTLEKKESLIDLRLSPLLYNDPVADRYMTNPRICFSMVKWAGIAVVMIKGQSGLTQTFFYLIFLFNSY